MNNRKKITNIHRKIAVSIFVVCIILFSNIIETSFASLNFSGHWIEREIEAAFIEQHIEDITMFSPDETISREDFEKHLADLIRRYGCSNGETEEILSENLTRVEATTIVAEKLSGIGVLEKEEGINNPFKDLNKLNPDQVNKILLLYKAGIIKGDTYNNFLPEHKLTQAEAFAILQRVKNFMGERRLEFSVVEYKTQYSATKEGMTISDVGDTIRIKITKQTPHPGYTLKVEYIEKAANANKIHLKIQQPDPDKMYPQVITYHIIVLEISKASLGEVSGFVVNFRGSRLINFAHCTEK